MKKTSTEKKVTAFDKLSDARRQQAEDHHMEVVAEVDGVTWINNSMATTVEATWQALRDIDGPVLLVLGGIDRSNEYAKLSGLVAEKVKAVIFMGSPREKYFGAFQPCTNGLVCEAADLAEAVQIASAYGYAGDTVLFSPCCPSYHAFDNYKNRGNEFKKLVNGLAE